jgi:ribulose kinase
LLADCTNRSLANIEAPDAAVAGAALLGSGAQENPHSVQSSGVTAPREDQAALLAERRVELLDHIKNSRARR